jgi:hypothetical protein
MQYLSFWIWFISFNMKISSSIHFPANGMISCFFICTPLYVSTGNHQLLLPRLSPYLGYCKQWYCKHGCTCCTLIYIPSDIWPEMAQQDHIIVLALISLDLLLVFPIDFHSGCSNLRFTNSVQGFLFPCILTNIYCSLFSPW